MAFCSVSLRFEAVVSQQEGGRSGGDLRAFLVCYGRKWVELGKKPSRFLFCN